MKRHTAPQWWLTPWLTPLAFSALYLVELGREGAFAEPLMLLTQIVFAAPLVAAGSVLLLAIEQEVRAHALTPRLRAWVVWTPRVLLLCFVAVLALFSLDVFEPDRTLQQIVLGLFLHNLPALALLAVTALAWRWPWVGAVGLAAFASWWLVGFGASGFLPSVFLLLAVLPLTLASLFLASQWLRGPRPDKTAEV